MSTENQQQQNQNFIIRRSKPSKSIVIQENNSQCSQRNSKTPLRQLTPQTRISSFRKKIQIQQQFQEIGQKQPVQTFISKLKRSITISTDSSTHTSPQNIHTSQNQQCVYNYNSTHQSNKQTLWDQEQIKKRAQKKIYDQLIQSEIEKHKVVIERGFSSRPNNLKNLKQFQLSNFEFENLQNPELRVTCKTNGIYLHQINQEVKHGRAYEFFCNGDSFVGYYQNNKRSGVGRYIFSNGDYYEGDFYNNQINGNGIMFYSNSERYIGQFKNDKKWGYGQYYYKNGDIYSGMWKDDMKHGQGSMKYASLQYLEVKCVYKDNVKIKTETNLSQIQQNYQ
ncbi:hypothetical protein ABPG74_012236 [Tetrahymena malaccensis]